LKPPIQHLYKGKIYREGAGVKLCRFIGAEHHDIFDPFLLLDYFDSEDPLDYIAGFPFHPHRGFETVTYLLNGEIAHEDNHGNKGSIKAGEVQWMNAGRGIIHSEMPTVSDRLRGFQLWLNLPQQDKMKEPSYQDFKQEEFAELPLGAGGKIKLITGTLGEVKAPLLSPITNPSIVDVILQPGDEFNYTFSDDQTCIILIIEGQIKIKGQTFQANTLLHISPQTLQIASADEEGRFILIAANKLREPIARLGPFVMNTQEEIRQAITEFRNNQF
jgi:redox-sensitive bicupin YhaK (pirin superfamily)